MSHYTLRWYVRDAGSRAAHHLDYEREALDHALCGWPFGDIISHGEDRRRSVCRACQERLEGHEKNWWRSEAAFEREAKMVAEEAYGLALKDQQRLEQKALNQRRELTRLRGSVSRV